MLPLLFTLFCGPAHADDALSDATAGRPALVTFWASWCGPCRTELPRIDALHDRLDPQRATVVAVNLDRSPRAGRALLQRLGVDVPVVWDARGEVAAQFAPPELPAAYLVDAEGRVVRSWMGELDEAEIAEAEAALAAHGS